MISLVRTIDTDPDTLVAVGHHAIPEVPPAEWTYRWLRDRILGAGPQATAAYLHKARQKARRLFDGWPEYPAGASLERTVVAYVNWSRWMWTCPTCNSAQVCTPDDPRAFCVECFNAGDGWWPILFPPDQDRTDGELVLSKRPEDTQRSWYPDRETVEQLQAENLRHGLDADVPGRPWPGTQAALAAVREHFQLGPGEYVRVLSEAALAEDERTGERTGIGAVVDGDVRAVEAS